MPTENDLMQKLMISKKIMDKHNTTPRNPNPQTYNYNTSVQEFDVPQAKFNIPQEYMMESQTPIRQTNEVPTKDRIMSSKLPDEIKRLMIEHPIAQPTSMGGSSVLSNDLIEKASRLMKNDVANNVDPFKKQKQPTQEYTTPQNIGLNVDKNTLKDMIRETIEEVLGENGLLVESTSKSNDLFQFRVGSHIFEGKVTRIKKVK
jgi:hypothetical protein